MAINKDFKVKNGIPLSGQLTSTVATGTAPLVIASTTLVTNLNADLLDGMQAASANTASTVVSRDASGKFSAGTISAALTGNVTGNVSGTAATITGVYSGSLTSLQVTNALTFTPYNATNPSGYTANTGTVTTASVVTANGFAGTVATAGTTPAITLSTSIAGMLKGNGTAISAATAGTDYSAGTNALATGILKSTTTTGALSIAVAGDFPTLNQNTTGTAANVTGTVAIANGGTGAVTAPLALAALGAYAATNPSGYTANLGTVTGVTATAPVVSSGGTAPVISMAAATTAVPGYLTAADWNTFNGKQAALGFTPYNATNPSGYTANTGTVTTVSVATANGISGTVATATTTPAITLTLGAITPTSIITTGDITVGGNFTVNGTTTTINATTLSVADLNITVGSGATTAAAANGAGLTIGNYASNPTLLYGNALDNFTFNRAVAATGFSGPLTGNVTGNVSGTAATITGVYGGTLTSAQVTTALTYTPYNSTNPSGYTANLGTVTGVTATGPVVSSGGTAPVISMAAATTAVPGYLTAADWNTFNGKQAALGFTPYNSTNPSGYTANTGTVTSISVVSSSGVSGTVATATTTPAITLTLGALTGTSFNGITGLSATTPVADGTAAVGVATTAARADHVHPSPTVSTVANIAGGAIGQIPVQSGASTTVFDPEFTFDTTNHVLNVGTTIASAYTVGIGGASNTFYQGATDTGSMILRSRPGNAIRLYTDYGTGVRGGNINFYAGGSDNVAGAGSIQLSTGVNTNAGYSGVIKMIGAVGYWVAPISGSGATAIDLGTQQSTYLDVSLAAATTFSFVTTTAIGSAPYHEVRMRFAANTFGYAVTWPASVTWISGTAPVISTTAFTTVSLFTYDGGTTYLGYTLGTSAVTSVNGNVGAITAAQISAAATTGYGFTPYSNANPSGYITSAGNAATATTAATANALATGNNYQVNSLGIGTPASGVAGEIRATNNITAYYSDDRLKTRTGNIENALAKVATLDAFYYHANETAQALGYAPIDEVGISAQQVQAIMPQVVAPAPIDDKYLTVRYERLVPLLIAAIKELQAEVEALKAAK
jgi:hypothetical protein